MAEKQQSRADAPAVLHRGRSGSAPDGLGDLLHTEEAAGSIPADRLDEVIPSTASL